MIRNLKDFKKPLAKHKITHCKIVKISFQIFLDCTKYYVDLKKLYQNSNIMLVIELISMCGLDQINDKGSADRATGMSTESFDCAFFASKTMSCTIIS